MASAKITTHIFCVIHASGFPETVNTMNNIQKASLTQLLKYFFIPIVITLVSANNAMANWQQHAYSTMGTNILIEVYHADANIRQQAIDKVVFELERINQSMSTYIATSDISQLNATAFASPQVVSDEIFKLLELSAQVSKLSDGAFDITYASVGYLYNFPNRVKPNEQEIDELLSAIDYRHVKLNKQTHSVQFLHPNVKIDLGGIAKGYAVDQSIKILKTLGIEHALVTAGGDTRLLGDKDGKPWIVGIRDPRNKGKQAVVLPLADSAMSTSGDYERYFEQDGKRFHHIISPKTGKSANTVQSVSIIGPESVYNDALSTAVFVMGLEQGLGFINALPNFEAVVMDSHRRLHFSDGLQKYSAVR